MKRRSLKQAVIDPTSQRRLVNLNHLLAAHGVDLNASTVTKRPFIFPDIDHARWTALQHAVQKRQAEAVRVLLEWGAEPDATEPGSTATPSFIATSYNDRPTVTLLLDAGADSRKLALFRTMASGQALARCTLP